MSTNRKKDKRQAIRVVPEADFPVRIDLMGDNLNETTTAVDVSNQGIGINVPLGFRGSDLDSLLKINIWLPEPTEYSFSATVKIIHQKGKGLGAQFERIEKKDAKKLHEYIEQQLKHMSGDAILEMVDGDDILQTDTDSCP